MDKLSKLMRSEIQNYLDNSFYCYNSDMVKDIIMHDKYKTFWTGNIRPYMLNQIICYFWFNTGNTLLLKYKIKSDVLIKSFLPYITIEVLNRYNITEQTCIIRAMMTKDYVIIRADNILLHYMLSTCGYSITEWKFYKSNNLTNINNCKHATGAFIESYIKNQMLFDKSLRNKWLLACAF